MPEWDNRARMGRRSSNNGAGRSRWRFQQKRGKGSGMTTEIPTPNPPTPGRPKPPTGAGAFIAVLVLAGAIGGGLLGQPSIGLLTGLGAGVALAIVLWLKERKG
jgi:hypothetical protein